MRTAIEEVAAAQAGNDEVRHLRAEVARLSAQVESVGNALVAFVKAYERQDADNFTDDMRDAYAAASLLTRHQQVTE